MTAVKYEVRIQYEEIRRASPSSCWLPLSPSTPLVPLPKKRVRERALETFLRSILQNEGIPAITDYNGKLITGPTEKANSLNSNYSSVLRCE
jgi:hypothetical protein